MATIDGSAPRNAERRFYGLAALVAALIAFAGFARTYYLKGAFEAPELPGLVHLHGLVMTGWIVLFGGTGGPRGRAPRGPAPQARHRRRSARRARGGRGHRHRHRWREARRLAGPAAARLPRDSPRRDPGLRRPGGAPRSRTAAARTGTSGSCCSRPSRCSRPAIARIPIDALQAGGIVAFMGVTDLLAIACIAWDTARNRRLHPAFLRGGLFLVLSHPAMLALAGSAFWMEIARRIVG